MYWGKSIDNSDYKEASMSETNTMIEHEPSMSERGTCIPAGFFSLSQDWTADALL